MKILYHHRTRSTDAQRIHIQKIAGALEGLGHQVEIVSLVPTDAQQNDASRDAGDAWWKKLVRRIPLTYEAIQVGYNLVGLALLLRRMVGRKVDFIYERYALFNFSGVIAAGLFRVPLILEVNSPLALELVRDGEIKLEGLARWSERWICSHATRVLVVSTPLARIMESEGVPAGKLEVMVNGVDLEEFHGETGGGDLRKSLGIEGYTVIGFVGWFRKWHRLDDLLEAFSRANLRGRAKVMLIGDGQAMADLRRYVEERDLKSDVIFTGPLPHHQVPHYVSLIDIAVQPAANEYCCPMKILEYMGLGKPIVAPRQENIQDLLRDDGEAQFFAPGNVDSLAEALHTLVGDPERARKMGERVRRAITERGFLWTENAARVVRMVDGSSRAAVDKLLVP